MSVLFKALERAAEENRRHEPGAPPAVAGPEAHLLPARRRRPARRRLGLFAISLVAVPLVGILVSVVLDPRETKLLLGDLIGLVSPPSARPPAPPVVAAAPLVGLPAAEGASDLPAPGPTEPLPAVVAAIEPLSAPAITELAIEMEPRSPVPAPAVSASASAPPPATAAPEPATVASAPRTAVPPRPVPPRPVPRPAERGTADSAPAATATADRPAGPPVAVAPSAVPPAAASPAGGAIATREAPEEVRDRMHVAGRLLVARELDAARAKYEEVLAIEPRNISALFGRALALHLHGRHDDARAAYGRLLELDPRNGQAEANYLMLLAEVDVADALPVMKRLAAANPDSAALQAGIGMTEARVGNVPAAVSHLRAAIARDPGSAALRLNLAVVLDRAGRREEALAAYRTALDLPVDPHAPLPLPIEQVRNRMRFLAAGG